MRITAVVALLAAVALLLSGLISFAVQRDRIADRTAQGIAQEFAELRKLAASNEPFANAGDLLLTYLQRNVPTDNEVLVSWLSTGPARSSPTGSKEVAESPALGAAVRPLLESGGTASIDLPDYGPALASVQPVQVDGTSGALVIVTYLRSDRAELQRATRTYALVAGLSLLLVIGVAGWAAGRLLAPLRVLRTTTEEISGTDLACRIPVTGNDDLTALTRTVNHMLERLEDAFAGQRRFLDDAGHELKTPLTVLRGHLEVLDVGDTAEIAETRDLLLDEVDRMARLVGDLIMLAKSDRPDFVSPVPVDLEHLTDDLLAKARGLGDRTWIADERASGQASLDPQRITQAMLQMAENAVKHTGPGDVVAIGSACEDGVVRLWVRDTGPGIPVADRDLVFERFGRSIVLPDDEGFGLGLSLVRAIARAHGGEAHIQDAVPHGALVELRISRGTSTKEDPWPAS